MTRNPGAAASADTPGDKAAQSGRSEALTSLQQRTRDTIAKIRERADLTAKALGGLGTSVLTAAGIAKFGDIFPWPATGWRSTTALIAVVGGFVVMAFGVAFFTYRLWKVNEPVLMQTDLDSIELKGDERDIATEMFGRIADEHDADTLRAYELRGLRLRRIAKFRDETEAKRLNDEADEIEREVSVAMTLVAADVVRKRAARAIRGTRSIIVALLFLVGVLAFGIGADYLASQRTDQIAVVKSCGEARTANAKGQLPAICGDVPAKPKESPSPRIENAKGIEGLAGALTKCETAAEETQAQSDACETLRRALQAALSP